MAPGIRNKWLLLSSCSNILSTSPHATLWLPSSYSYLILIHPAQKRGEKAQKVSSLPWGIYSGCYMWLLLTSSCWLELQSHGHSSCKGGWGIFFLTEHIAISNKVDREEEEKRHWHTHMVASVSYLKEWELWKLTTKFKASYNGYDYDYKTPCLKWYGCPGL